MNFLTVQEAAHLLRLSPATIRRYAASGKLDAVRIGRTIGIERSGIVRFLSSAGSATADQSAPAGSGHPPAPDSLFWRIVGKVNDDEPRDVSRHHDLYLAEAYADRHVSPEERTVKEQLYRAVVELNDDQATWVLAYLRAVANKPDAGLDPPRRASPGAGWEDGVNLLGSLFGIGHSGEPTDVANHKDEWVADAGLDQEQRRPPP